MNNRRIWVIIGTRPEVIKQAPLYLHMQRQLGAHRVALVSTGQHTDLLQQALNQFDLQADISCPSFISGTGHNLGHTNGNLLNSISDLIQAQRPSAMIVQGDTSTAAMAALAGFYNHVPIYHNEAGLRSYDLEHPFPEEANRKFVSVVANVNFCPTLRAKEALLAERINEASIEVVGNTGIDALKMVLQKEPSDFAKTLIGSSSNRNLVLITAHRRENSSGMATWFDAVKNFIGNHSDLKWIYTFHPNNLAREIAIESLGNLHNVLIIPPLDFCTTAHILNSCRFVVTDSGGIQEEAATLGVPTVICRDTTERPEVLDWGTGRICGTRTESVIEGMNWAYNQKLKASFMPNAPFGQGDSSERILSAIIKRGLIS